MSDPIAHSSALGGLLVGLAVGAAIAMAGVAIVGTGGLAAVAVVASRASAAAGLGELIGSLSLCTNDAGQILEGSPNVFIGGGTVQTDKIAAEVPLWLELAVAGL